MDGLTKVIEKYAAGTWQRTRMAFLRAGDIFRVRKPDRSDDWKVYVASSDPHVVDGVVSMEVMLYKLMKPCSFTDDMTHVTLEKPDEQ